MNLDRKPFAGEEIFDEQFGIARRRNIEPDFTDRRLTGRRIGKSRPKLPPPPGFFNADRRETQTSHDAGLIGKGRYNTISVLGEARHSG